MRRWAWGLLFAAAGGLYAVSRDAYFVGFFNDDAFYLIGARSLLGGAFLELNHPAAPPLVQYLPGWPLLLMPAAALGGFLPAQLTAAAAMLASAAAAAWCFAPDLDEDGRLMLAALCALNPLAVSLSGAVLADAPFTLALLMVLGAARRLWKSEDPAVWFALGAAAGASFLIRPVGLALPVALAGALAWEGRRREALGALCGAAAAAVPWLARNLVAGGKTLLYFSEFTDPWRTGGGVGRPLENAAFYLGELYARTLVRWPTAAGTSVAGLIASAGGLGLAAAGLRRLGLSDGRRAGVIAAVSLAGAVILWEKRSGRYLLPLVPFAAAWALAALSGLSPRLRAAAVLLALASYLPPAAAIARASRSPTAPPARGPERTWEWVRENTPADAVFGAELDGRLFLRTGRRALTPPRNAGPAALAAWAGRSGVTHILVEDVGNVMRTAGGSGAHDPLPAGALAAAAAGAYLRLAFADPEERTAVYSAR